ncbi:MAG: hypothetical protein HC927_07915, partial [Deltaproteobacteria bacterium]|nr:hypothetical protein [Deltaproteobacteria bacterium]
MAPLKMITTLSATEIVRAVRSGRLTPPEVVEKFERWTMLEKLDHYWREHLAALDHLRQGIGLRAYGQRDPLNEYKSEAFNLFNRMLVELRERVTSLRHITVTHGDCYLTQWLCPNAP